MERNTKTSKPVRPRKDRKTLTEADSLLLTPQNRWFFWFNPKDFAYVIHLKIPSCLCAFV